MRAGALDTSFWLPPRIVVPPPPKMPGDVARYWEECLEAGQEHDVCPILLSALHWRETRSGALSIPRGPEGTGDWDLELDEETGKQRRVGELGHGRGLFQIDDRAHAAWVAKVNADGVPLWKIPIENARKAAEIYADKRARFGPIGGVAGYNTKEKWVAKVLAEARHGLAPHELVAALDRYTAHHTYVAEVLGNRERWQNGWRPGVVASV